MNRNTATDESKLVLVNGATGLIGSALGRDLSARGHRIRTLSRSHGDGVIRPGGRL